MLLETAELYQKVTLPFVDSIPASRVAWVENILEGKAEADRVMAKEEDALRGWVLLPDIKWDHTRAGAALAELKKLQEEDDGEEEERKDKDKDKEAALAAASDRAKSATESLYAQLIFRDPKLRSLRDIVGGGESSAVDVVSSAVSAAFGHIKQHYGLPQSSLRAFFHYHPSYWRLHVHICGPQVVADDAAGRAHLVEDVLEAARAVPGWWRERSLTARSFRGDGLAEALIKASGGVERE